MAIGAVRCILRSCEMGRVAKMRCVAFDLDTVKLLMNIFVRDLMQPVLFSMTCLTFLVCV